MFKSQCHVFAVSSAWVMGFLCGSAGKESACNAGDPGLIPGLGRSLGERPHSRTLAWRIPWTEEPDRLQSLGLQREGQNWVTNIFIFIAWAVLFPTYTQGLLPYSVQAFAKNSHFCEWVYPRPPYLKSYSRRNLQGKQTTWMMLSVLWFHPYWQVIS